MIHTVGEKDDERPTTEMEGRHKLALTTRWHTQQFGKGDGNGERGQKMGEKINEGGGQKNFI